MSLASISAPLSIIIADQQMASNSVWRMRRRESQRWRTSERRAIPSAQTPTPWPARYVNWSEFIVTDPPRFTTQKGRHGPMVPGCRRKEGVCFPARFPRPADVVMACASDESISSCWSVTVFDVHQLLFESLCRILSQGQERWPAIGTGVPGCEIPRLPLARLFFLDTRIQ